MVAQNVAVINADLTGPLVLNNNEITYRQFVISSDRSINRGILKPKSWLNTGGRKEAGSSVAFTCRHHSCAGGSGGTTAIYAVSVSFSVFKRWISYVKESMCQNAVTFSTLTSSNDTKHYNPRADNTAHRWWGMTEMKGSDSDGKNLKYSAMILQLLFYCFAFIFLIFSLIIEIEMTCAVNLNSCSVRDRWVLECHVLFPLVCRWSWGRNLVWVCLLTVGVGLTKAAVLSLRSACFSNIVYFGHLILTCISFMSLCISGPLSDALVNTVKDWTVKGRMTHVSQNGALKCQYTGISTLLRTGP